MISEIAYPLRFRPLLKQTIWGGTKLGSLLGKQIGTDANDAESWEVVDHGDDQSVVTDGPLSGKTLSQLIQSDPKWMLGENADETAYPLLLKYLDCNRVLSVQVHPDDRYGAQMEIPDRGKTEAWYVVSAEPGSLIYAGLKEGVDRGQLADAMTAGETDSVLHSFEPEPGDCVFIPAGTVHALGAGLVIAEIQQSSNTTFRLFDWNRVDANGNSRPLHIEQSLEVTDYVSGPVAAKKSDRAFDGWQTLVDCDKFLLRVLESGTGTIGGDNCSHVITVPRGEAVLKQDTKNGGAEYRLRQGESMLLPASIGSCVVEGQENTTVLASKPR